MPPKRSFRRKRVFPKRKRIHKKKGRGPSMLKYKLSRTTHQVIPDRYFCWIETNNTGHWAAAAGPDATFAVNASYPITPFNSAWGSTIPNPLVAIASANPAGLKNIIYNAAQATGLYHKGRVWRSIITVEFAVQAAADAMMVAIAPLVNGDSYASYTTIAQGPGSKTRSILFGASGKDNKITLNCSHPKVFGVPTKEFAAVDLNSFSYLYAQANQYAIVHQVRVQNLANAAFGNAVAFSIRCRYYCEFYNRVDTALLDV